MSELNEATRTLVSRLAALAAAKADIEAEERQIKADLRASLDIGQWTWQGTPVLSLAPTRRFNAEHAATILPADLLILCRSDKLDGATAKKVLPPGLYTACQTESGEPTVRVL